MAGATTTAGSPSVSAAAAPSVPTARSISSGTSSACRPRWPSIEYDPNRSARIALLHYADGEKRYILAPVGVEVGQTLMSGPEADILPGNALALENIPPGTVIHNIELRPGKGGQMVRSAGVAAQLVAREDKYALVRLPSGEVRKVLSDCMATIGQVGNVEHENISLGKAGRTRWLGRRPHNRGVMMNPVDHPHGGGEGTYFRRPASGDAVGAADARLPDPEQQAHRAVHRQQEVEEEKVIHGPFTEKRTVCRRAPRQEDRGYRRYFQNVKSFGPGPGVRRSCRSSLGKPSPSTTARSSFRCISPKTWWATSWESLPRPGRSRDMQAVRRSPPEDRRRSTEAPWQGSWRVNYGSKSGSQIRSGLAAEGAAGG